MQNTNIKEIRQKRTIIDEKINNLLKNKSIKDNPAEVSLLAEVTYSQNVIVKVLNSFREKPTLKKIT